MKLVLLHGWGFDASIWDAIRAALAPIETLVWDQGYFGPRRHARVPAPFIAIGHSLGSLLLAADPPAGCVGLIAINGFDRFAGEGLVPMRLLDRMRARFADAPEAVLDDFRLRAGGAAHDGAINADRLAADLDRLATMDARGGMMPRLVLHGGGDPILPAEMLDQVFAGAPRLTRADAGHLLPVSHPGWCAARVRDVLR
jgi:pimeloyl-[acyl-carrier protein] methyl ester esterase